MKSHTLLFFALVTVLSAQDKPKDPFIKDKKAAAAAAPASASPAVPADGVDPATPVVSEGQKNIQCLIESFTLPQADYAALLDAPDGQDKLHANLLAAVKGGTARLDACHMITTRNGTRCVLECVDELIYPTEWTPADRAGFQYPTVFEMRHMGDHFEFEPTLDEESGAMTISQEFKRDRFSGFRLYKADTTLAGIPVAEVLALSSTSSCRMLPGFPTLIATLKDAQPGGLTLVFATLQVVPLRAPQAAPAGRKGNLHITARVISLERMKGWELLKKHAADGGACLSALKPLLAAKEATLEHIATITAEAGVRSLHESGLIYPYGTEFSPPTEGVPAQPSDDPKKPGTPARLPGLAGTTYLENRSTGFRLELETTASEDGAFAEMTLAPEYVSMTGKLKDKNWNEHYPELPLFSTQKITTGYAQVIGTTALVGTLNPPGDTGANEHKDEGRVWLLFMDVKPE